LLQAPGKAHAKPRRWLWRRWYSALFKVAAAVAVASLAVAYQERATRSVTGQGAPPSGVASPADVKRLFGHQGPVIAVTTADEGRWIVSASADTTLRLWSAASGALVRTIKLEEGAATAFAADARRALVGHRSGAIVLWDLELGEKLATFQHGSGIVTSVEFLGEGFVAARQDGSVALFGLGTPSAPPVLLDAEDGGGPLLAAARPHGVFVAGGSDRAVRLWRAPGPRLARTYRRLPDDITAIAISPDARRIAGGSGEGVVRVWQSPAWRGVRSRDVQRLKAHEGRVTAIALGPPNLLATAGQDGSIKLWSLHTMRMVRALPAGQVHALSFSPDGRQLLAGGQDGAIQVWAVPTAMGAT
jgi:WD40 repeat protein